MNLCLVLRPPWKKPMPQGCSAKTCKVRASISISIPLSAQEPISVAKKLPCSNLWRASKVGLDSSRRFRPILAFTVSRQQSITRRAWQACRQLCVKAPRGLQRWVPRVLVEQHCSRYPATSKNLEITSCQWASRSRIYSTTFAVECLAGAS